MGQALIEAVGGWWWILAIAVAILGVGRLSRVVTHDLFPPAIWLRQTWTNWTVKHGHQAWTSLFYCWWCFTPWLMAVCIAWFALTFAPGWEWTAWAWWLLWGWLAVSYLASIILARDEPASPDDSAT